MYARRSLRWSEEYRPSRKGLCNYGASEAAVVGYVSLAIAAAGATTAAVSAHRQAQYQSAVAENNAKIAGVNAQEAIQEGQQKEQAKRLATAQLIGKERAAAAASGVDVDTGSPLKIQTDTAQLGELDALTIRSNAARQAWNLSNQQMGFAAEAQQDRNAGNLEAFSSLIGGASSVSSKWSSYSQAGVFS